ncbi:heme-dependent oxidative N-demethylase family protein [Ilumatobacter coccineus]|uniref:DUF3445 domain-containing protein n=1 Tax=Ilumatobacter coccineus (strain NBRC 103263 / KCTC 29153 / YM16-304) TaxID=1313172 RepID=A0A6C7EBV3_ILUCY|nr:DUF3445 domain-containing protein [Ilumatobacter coccineus]BAN04217.1 hypothetical protein YM304_39030 [Ilumatobacter coccineus YM16-304]
MPLVGELPYRPWAQRGQVVEGEFRWRLGTHPLDLANWIEWGPDAPGWIDEKPALLAAHRDTVFSVLDGIEPEADEVATAIAHHVGADLDTSMHPLEAAARLVPDDLVLMVERDDRFVFGGGSVCFPNRWDLPSKIGRTMAEVHAPVADLNRQLEPAIDAFFDRLRPERSFWRLGWGLIDSPDGFEPPRSSPRPSVHPDDDDVYVRVERETLRRFPVTNCVLFTIRTYLAPITTLSADDRSRVRAAVAAMAPGVRAYKDVVSG